MRKYTIDESVFDSVDSEEKAYWLGFITADGSICIRKSGQHVLKLALASQDVNHLVKFLKFLKCDMPIKTYKSTNKKTKVVTESCEVTITSKKIVEDLKSLGVDQRKTHTVCYPDICKSLNRHFIRGVWDGDGTVSFLPTRKKYPDNITPRVQLCGNKNILMSIQDIFEKELNVQKSKLTKTSSIFLFAKGCTTAKKICKYLYTDSEIYLDRKYETSKKCVHWTPRKKGR